MMLPEAHAWSSLSKQRLGRYAEYYVKMAFTLGGLDVYTPEVDDRGLDFIVRAGPGRFYEFQVKAARGLNTYMFMRKAYFVPSPDLYLAVALFTEGREPDLYLVPSTRWLDPSPPFVSRDYEGLKSPPEWGLNLSKGAVPTLEPYRFETMIGKL